MEKLKTVFLLVIFSTSTHAQFTGYIWPTDASPYLTSTFAETRSAHFHAGLDIKTWGREGYQVFASKGGIISRMAITAKGYGRVLYMKHDDGTYTVYAHLQRFIPELQAFIDSVRLIDYQFEIDVNVESKNWRFEQGDTIGFTGSTGIGPPHLHFEIRDQNQHPINALQTNLNIEDTIPPRIPAVLIIPMSDSSTVEGNRFPTIYYPRENQSGKLTLGTIRANGPVAIAINEFDEANSVTNKYASYEYRVLKGEEMIFYSKHDTFDFEETKTMFLDRIAAHKASRRSYQTLFNDSRENIPFYKEIVNNGILIPTDSTQPYLISVNDFYKNTTQVQFELLQSKFAETISENENMEIRDWYWRNNWLTKHKFSSLNLVEQKIGVTWNSELNQQLSYLNEEEIIFQRISPNKAHTITSPDKNLEIHFSSNTFFDSLSVGAFISKLNGLPSISILPATAPVRKDFFIEFYLGDDFKEDENYRLFHFDHLKDRLTYVPSNLVGRTLHAQSKQMGEFLVLPDNEPPTIGSVKIDQTNYGEWRVVLEVVDELSGINFESSEIQINGVRGITEYDFEEDKLIYIHPDFTPNKENRIDVILTDNAGNSKFESFYR